MILGKENEMVITNHQSMALQPPNVKSTGNRLQWPTFRLKIAKDQMTEHYGGFPENTVQY